MRIRVNNRLAGAAVMLLTLTWASVSPAGDQKAEGAPPGPHLAAAVETVSMPRDRDETHRPD